MPNVTVDRYAVIGNPIVQSKSPLIHSLFASATAQAMEYVKVQGRIGDFASHVNELRAGGMRGLNVTTPFKLDACAYASELSESARLAGAANALKFEGDRVWAENFDGLGLVHDIEKNLGFAMRGKRVLLLGAGGAVRGALLPIARARPATLVLANRTLEKAQELVHVLDAQVQAVRGAAQEQTDFRACALDALEPGFDVVINATSASLHDQAPAIAASVFAANSLAYDMVYGRGATPFLRLAGQAGAARLADGVGMLVEQAALAFEWWRGVRPDTQAVIAQLTVPLLLSDA